MQCSRYSCQILKKLEFSRQIFKNTQISNFVKIHPVGAQLLHVERRTDGRTDTSKLILNFHIFSNPSNIKEQKPKELQNT
jgi:hypothetical protein